MATSGHEMASDEIPDTQCVSCVNRKVVKYCIDCQGYCCQTCVSDHSRFPALKVHTLLDKSEFQTPVSSTAKLPRIPTERCDIHTIKLLDMYCGDHDTVGCTTCMALDHRSCKNVHSIPDDIDLLFEPTEIPQAFQHLQENTTALEEIKMKKDVLLEELHVSKVEADNAIKNAKREIITAVDDLEKTSLEEVMNVFKVEKRNIEKEREEAAALAGALEKVSSNLKQSEGNKAQRFVCLKISTRRIAEAKIAQSSLKMEKTAKINFTVDPNIEECFRNRVIFGTINTETALKERTETYKVKTFNDMNVKLPQDSSSCYIWGSCLTADGSYLLVDYNNKKLKRANMSTLTVDTYCTFEANPYYVCCVGKQEAVVTFHSKADFIQFVSLGSQLTPSRKLTIGHHCLGIAFKEEKLYITDNNKTVYVHDMAGNQLQAISCDNSGKYLFSCTRRIAFNGTTNSIIVADWHKGVIILDENYQQVTSFSDSELTHVEDVCTDSSGNIFVCGLSSHNVIQIGNDGKRRGVVVRKSDNLNCPHSISFDSSKCRLIITQGSDTVKIFYLK